MELCTEGTEGVMIRAKWMRFSLLACLLANFAPNCQGKTEQLELSDYFVVETSSSRQDRHQDLYVRSPDGALHYIGTTSTGNWDRPFSGAAFEGLRQGVLALSEDGRSLVFLHESRLSRKGRSKESGIYVHRFGEAERLLVPGNEHRPGWSRISERVPSDILVFHLTASVDPKGQVWAVNTEGVY